MDGVFIEWQGSIHQRLSATDVASEVVSCQKDVLAELTTCMAIMMMAAAQMQPLAETLIQRCMHIQCIFGKLTSSASYNAIQRFLAWIQDLAAKLVHCKAMAGSCRMNEGTQMLCFL